MTEILVREREDRGIHHLTLDHGANALDLSFVDHLRSLLAVLVNQGAPPLILSSSHSSVFSPGWNLKSLDGASRTDVERFLRSFNALIFDVFTYPSPTAVAINGHAVAGGCLLAMACDLRVMASGRPRIGLSEVNLGVPVPASCIRMLQARLSPGVMDDLIFAGSSCTAERAFEQGIVHKVAAPNALLRSTEQFFLNLAGKPRSAVVGSKRFRFARVWSDMKGLGPEADDVFLDAWFEDGTQERIHALVQRLAN